MSKESRSILFLFPYPADLGPSQRFRFFQYLSELEHRGVSYTLRPLYSVSEYSAIYRPGTFILYKVLVLVYLFFKRFFQLFSVASYSVVFIHRELYPLGPPIFEWIIAKVFKKKIIYDFDDAIWLPQYQDKPRLLDKLRNPSKVNSIIKWSWKVSCGNAYLAQHARIYNQQVVINPTTIDTEYLHNRIKDQRTEKLVIGWTGTYSTLMYLEPLIPLIRKLEEQYDFELLVIANQKPDFDCRSLRFIPWNKDTEIDDLLRMNVGVMPLLDDDWTRGKCGFKALQYMALGIPAVISPVGVNTEIVTQGVNGYLCATDEEWYRAFEALLKNPELRIQQGKAARETVLERYSVKSNTDNFLNLFE